MTFSDGIPLDAVAVAVATNFNTFRLGNKDLGSGCRSRQQLRPQRSHRPTDYQVRFKAPAPGFLQATWVFGSGLLAPTVLDSPLAKLGDTTKIIGSGAFVVESEMLGQSLNLALRHWAIDMIEQNAVRVGRARRRGLHAEAIRSWPVAC